jgi:hypothetical protein
MPLSTYVTKFKVSIQKWKKRPQHPKKKGQKGLSRARADQGRKL